MDEASAYQVVSMLEGVVKRGTGRRISSLAWLLAGNIGTTNESRDTWFIGFSPDLAVGVFVGFDNPTPLGRRETGSSVAAPIFKAFMAEALRQAGNSFRIPPSVRMVRLIRTGRRLVRRTVVSSSKRSKWVRNLALTAQILSLAAGRRWWNRRRVAPLGMFAQFRQ